MKRAFILEVRSIAIKQFPVWGWPIWAWTKSNGRVYFTLTKDDAEIDGWDLLTHRELPCGAGQCYWSKSGSSGSRAVRFPVKTVKDSWVPVREGETERFESLIANLTNAVEIAPDGAAIRIKPKGKIQLHLWMDQGALVESFDITEDVLMKSGPTALRGGRASVEVLPAVGWIQLH